MYHTFYLWHRHILVLTDYRCAEVNMDLVVYVELVFNFGVDQPCFLLKNQLFHPFDF